jgi:hypothetical protein
MNIMPITTPFSETITGLDYNSATGVLSLTAGYIIPTTGSTFLPIGGGTLTGQTGVLKLGNTGNLFSIYSNANTAQTSTPSLFEVVSTADYPAPSGIKAGFGCTYVPTINQASNDLQYGFFAGTSPSGAINATGQSFFGVYGSTAAALTSSDNTKRTLNLYGIYFSAYNSASWNGTGTAGPVNNIITCGAYVKGFLGYVGATISGEETSSNSYGLWSTSQMSGVYNSATAGYNYGIKSVTTSSSFSGTGTVNSYGAYIDAAASAALTGGGTLTSWGLFEVNGRNNVLMGNLSIGKLTAPAVALDVVGAILNTTTIEAGTGFKCGGTAAVTDGTYTVGLKLTPVTGIDGTITVKGGIVTNIQSAT